MASPHTIDDLRAELFDTLKRLKDKDAPLDVGRAKAVVEVASVIVDTARVEVAMLEATGEGNTGFLPDRPKLSSVPPVPQIASGGRR